MHHSKLICALGSLVLLVSSIGGATLAADDHVTLAKSDKQSSEVHAGQRATAVITFDLKNGYHARSHDQRNPEFIKFKVKIDENPTVKIGEAVYPPGVDDKEQGFDELVNVYRGQVVIRVPIDIVADAKTGPIKLTGSAHYQACKDGGQCDFPTSLKFAIQTVVVSSDTPVTAPAPELFAESAEAAIEPATLPTTAAQAPLEKLGPWVADFQPYTPELFNALRTQKKIVLIKFTANWCATCQVIAGTVFKDPAVWKDMREKNVYALEVDNTYDNPEGKALVQKFTPGGGIPLTVVFPPHGDKPFILASFYNSEALKKVLADATKDGVPPKQVGADWSLSFAFGAAFLAGLLFNIMPCVLPVLPLKAIGFYEVGQHKRSRSIMFGLVFSAGIISVFAILAVLVIVLKVISWGDLFSERWFIWSMVGLLIVMAFGLFGAFTFRLPVGAYSFEPRHDTFSGNFLLGGLTAILATPCTAPLLPGLLIWATSQPVYIGVPAMLMVGVGMASPYLILSALPEVARRFPRTGPWAELFKQMMGFMMLAAAAYFGAGRLFNPIDFWWVVEAVIVLAAIYMVGRAAQLSKNATPMAVTSVLALLMIGGSLMWIVRVTGFGRTPETASTTTASPPPADGTGANPAR